MPDNNDAKVPQVLRRQARQDLLRDLVFAERRLITFEAKAPQPIPTSMMAMIPEAIRRVQSRSTAWRSLPGTF